MRFELLAWGDGTIRLTFWDSDYGNDRSFILGVDGLAYEEAKDETRHVVDLIVELRKMVKP